MLSAGSVVLLFERNSPRAVPVLLRTEREVNVLMILLTEFERLGNSSPA